MSPAPGILLAGRYRLQGLAGVGGMASVFSALDERTGQAVAVKVILRQFRADNEFIAMFIEEARVGSELNHPFIVKVTDSGEDADHSQFLVMEWIDGLSLHELTDFHHKTRGTTPWGVVVRVIIDALDGLAVAHGRIKHGRWNPVIHRDLSPDNIMVTSEGRGKLTDFGLARARDRMTRLTRPGIVKGKMSYLAPELTIGREASPASDIFAMGIVLWEALAGRKLFEGTPVEALGKIMRAEITPLANVRQDLPPKLYAVVAEALHPDPQLRTPSASTMAAGLRAVVAAGPRLPDGWVARCVREARDARRPPPALPP